MSGATWRLDYENEGREIDLSVCPGDLEGTVHIHLEDSKGEPISASLDGIGATDVAVALLSYAYGLDADMIRAVLLAAVSPRVRKVPEADYDAMSHESKDWAEFWSSE